MKREKVGFSTTSTREPVEILMQIHDEVILEVREDVLEDVLSEVKNCMESVFPSLAVPTFNSYLSGRRLEPFVRCKNKLNLQIIVAEIERGLVGFLFLDFHFIFYFCFLR